MLKRTLTAFLLAGGFLLALAAPAAASPHVHEGINPFGHAGPAATLHCPKHGQHEDGPCPHQARTRGKQPIPCSISKDCGGLPQGTVPSVASVSHFADTPNVSHSGFSVDGTRLTPAGLLLHHRIAFDPLHPPPRFS